MELEWNQNFPFPSGSLLVPAGSVVQFLPTAQTKLRISIGASWLPGFVIYLEDSVLEQVKRALLSPEELVLHETARIKAVERRTTAPAAAPTPAIDIAEEV